MTDINDIIKGQDLPSASPGEFDTLIGVSEAGGRPLRRFSIPSLASVISSFIAFIQSGTGAVSRTMQDKGREVVSVKDFGAAGDGVTADNTAFANAKAKGGLVHIQKATGYAFSAPVVSNNADVAWFPDPTLTWDELTGGGQFSMWRGRATDAITNGSNIWRFSDRAFFGYAASAFAGDSHVGTDGGNGWLKTAADGPWYLLANGGVNFMNGLGDSTAAKNQPYGFVSAVKNSAIGGNGVIAFGAAVIQDSAAQAAWGGIVEGQREAGGNSIYGWEFAMKNKGSNATATPNSLATGGPAGVYGLWLHAQAHEDFGGVPTAPCTAAIALIGGDGPTGFGTWNAGIVFARDSITGGNAISMSSQTHTGSAHGIFWSNQAGNSVFAVRSDATDADLWQLTRSNIGLQLFKGANELFRVSATASAVNAIRIQAQNSTAAPSVDAFGSDTNIDLQLNPKGTGNVRFGTWTSNADAAVNGYVTIKDSAGNVRKLATIA